MSRVPVELREQVLEYWRGHSEAWKLSGLTQKAYCEQHNISLKNFGNWRAQLKRVVLMGSEARWGHYPRLRRTLADLSPRANPRAKPGVNPRVKTSVAAISRVGMPLTAMGHVARYLRFWLALAAIVCLVERADAATTVRVGNSSATAFNFMPLKIGIKQGYFAENGVDVQEIDLGGASPIFQAMIAGSIDMSLAAGTDIPFIMKGVPETGVGAIAITPALLGIIVPWNSPVHSLADLKGKKIGVSTEGSLTQWVAIEAAAKAGLARKDITFVTNGSSTAADIAALVTGEDDAQVSAVALGWNLEDQKKGRLLASAADFVGPFLFNVIYAQNDFIREHPDAVRGFLKGWYVTVNFMATHRAETIQFENAIDHFSDAVNEKQYDAVMPSLSRDGTLPPNALAATARSMVDLHMLPTEPDMMKFLTTRFLPHQR